MEYPRVKRSNLKHLCQVVKLLKIFKIFTSDALKDPKISNIINKATTLYTG